VASGQKQVPVKEARMTDSAPPPLTGVLETALYVAEIAPARAFYERVLGLSPLFADARLCAFDVGGRSVLLLFQKGTTLETVHMPGGTIPPHDGGGPVHFAFGVERDGLPRWEEHLAGEGVPIEGRTNWPRGGQSIYFRDPDGHLVELVTPGVWTIY
jgi:catechol 2,3-dioxygenase-like lactoylglutathione lyase family enzyme